MARLGPEASVIGPPPGWEEEHAATATANLTSIGGPADQAVIDGLVQEIDISTGRVLFQWDSADHVPYRDSQMPRPASASIPPVWSAPDRQLATRAQR